MIRGKSVLSNHFHCRKSGIGQNAVCGYALIIGHDQLIVFQFGYTGGGDLQGIQNATVSNKLQSFEKEIHGFTTLERTLIRIEEEFPTIKILNADFFPIPINCHMVQTDIFFTGLSSLSDSVPEVAIVVKAEHISMCFVHHKNETIVRE